MQMRYIERIALIIFSCLWPLNFIVCQTEYIYTISISSCKNEGELTNRRIQTGFKMESQTGIFTALHGVCGCNTIMIIDYKGRKYQNVKISSLDIDQDVALLKSPEIEDAIPESVGLKKADANIWATIGGKDVTIFGFPLEIEALDDIMARVSITPLQPLSKKVDSSTLKALRKRNSPSPDIDIVSLNGDILPGNSGSPVLYQNKIIAIADGGLKDGTVGRSWAIPINKIKFIAYKDAILLKRYQILETKPKNSLFSSKPLKNLTPTETFCDALDALITDAKNGFPHSAGPFLRDDRHLLYPVITYEAVNLLPGAKSGDLSVLSEVAGIKKGWLTNSYGREEHIVLNKEFIFSDKYDMVLDSNSYQYKTVYAQFEQLKDLLKKCLNEEEYKYEEKKEKNMIFGAIHKKENLIITANLFAIGTYWTVSLIVFNEIIKK